MSNRSVIPFGPQHPVLPEPLHLDLVVEDEVVVDVVPQIGYVHRGLERLVEKRDFNGMLYVAERICGICSFGHAMGYAGAVEKAMAVEVPERAQALRVIWHELSRIHSHILWLGLAADAFGFESLFMHSWRLRERVLDIFERTTGGRVIFSVVKVGGVKRDIADDELAAIVGELRDLEVEYGQIVRTMLEDETVRRRTEGVGRLSREEAIELSVVGPLLRSSGEPYDVRIFQEGGYGLIPKIEPIVSTRGDCLGRIEVRCAEVSQSVDIIAQMASVMPEGPVDAPVKGKPEAGVQGVVLLEQPRGEAFYYIRGNGTKNLDRLRVRTPTSQNLAGLVEILKGCELADVSTIILTIDPCISCTER